MKDLLHKEKFWRLEFLFSASGEAKNFLQVFSPITTLPIFKKDRNLMIFATKKFLVWDKCQLVVQESTSLATPHTWLGFRPPCACRGAKRKILALSWAKPKGASSALPEAAKVHWVEAIAGKLRMGFSNKAAVVSSA